MRQWLMSSRNGSKVTFDVVTNTLRSREKDRVVSHLDGQKVDRFWNRGQLMTSGETLDQTGFQMVTQGEHSAVESANANICLKRYKNGVEKCTID